MDFGFDRPNSARIYNYLLGGKDHFHIDRRTADELTRAFPSLPTTARANRAFLARVVRHLARDHGIRQYLDVGTGLPIRPSLHEIAQRVVPDCRVVYVDNDPVVLVHARALLTTTPPATVHCRHAGLHDPAAIIEAAGQALDLTEPVAVILCAVLHAIPDDTEVHRLLKHLTAPLCTGSAVAVSVATADTDPFRARAARRIAARHGLPVTLRRKQDVAALLAGLDLVDPGITLVHRWHPDPAEPVPADDEVHLWGAVALTR